jgi:hypothetical protein
MYADPEWEALNPPGFKYELERVDTKMAGSWHISCNFPGFVTRYAMCSVEDDKAEVFANMMTLPTWVECLSGADRTIRSKVSRMREMLADFCACADGNFWEAVLKAREKSSVNARGGNTMEILRKEEVED